MSRVRTFVAVDLEPAVRGRLIVLQKEFVANGAAVKWVEPENLHLTLLFLGEVREIELVNICRAVAAGAKPLPPFAARVCGVGGFPNLRRPRTLWVGVTDGADEVKELHAALEEPLFETGCYRRESRPFQPHVTLGRVAGDGATPLVLPRNAERWSGGISQVREVLVMTSELRPAGPEYSVISRAKLLGKPRPTEETNGLD